MLGQNVGGGLRKAILLGDIQPQENLTYVRNLNYVTPLNSDSSFFQIPSILNARNADFGVNGTWSLSISVTNSNFNFFSQTAMNNVRALNITFDTGGYGGIGIFAGSIFNFKFSNPVSSATIANEWSVSRIEGDSNLLAGNKLLLTQNYLINTASSSFPLTFLIPFIQAPDQPYFSLSKFVD
jgi:hypothetical protein